MAGAGHIRRVGTCPAEAPARAGAECMDTALAADRAAGQGAASSGLRVPPAEARVAEAGKALGSQAAGRRWGPAVASGSSAYVYGREYALRRCVTSWRT